MRQRDSAAKGNEIFRPDAEAFDGFYLMQQTNIPICHPGNLTNVN